MPTISSRTPEGLPNKCPLCGASVRMEPSVPAGDAPCPACGGLLWFAIVQDETLLFDAAETAPIRDAVQKLFGEHLGVGPDKLSPDLRLSDLAADSLDTVELVMELEEEFDINIPDDAAEKIQTVGQAVKYIEDGMNGKS